MERERKAEERKAVKEQKEEEKQKKRVKKEKRAEEKKAKQKQNELEKQVQTSEREERGIRSSVSSCEKLQCGHPRASDWIKCDTCGLLYHCTCAGIKYTKTTK